MNRILSIKRYVFMVCILLCGNILVYADSKSTYYTKANATVNPEGAGKVYVSLSSSEKGQEWTNSKGEKGDGKSYRTDTYYFTAESNPGYAFQGWYDGNTKKTEGLTYNESVTVESGNTSAETAKTITREARWNYATYTVTYDANDGSVETASKSVTYNSAYGTLTTASNSPHTFNGWWTAASGGTQVTSSTTVTTASDHDIYAHWIASQTITWTQEIPDKIRSNSFDLSASASSGLTVTYTASPAGRVSIVGNTVTCLTAGPVTITAHQAGNVGQSDKYTYSEASTVSKSFTISEHAITTNPTASGTLTYEQTLNTISPTGGVTNVAGSWAWKYPSSVPVVGTANQVAVFTPSSSVIDTVPLECNVSVTVNKANPDVTCTVNASTHYVDDTKIDLQSTWTREGDGAITYSVLSFEGTGSNNEGATTPYIESNRYLHLGKAGTATVKMAIGVGTNYIARNETIEVVINKRPNTLKCAWNNGSAGDDWDENMNFDSKLPVKFTSTNTSGPAISVTQSPASAVATFKNGAGGVNPDTIITNYREGTVTWTVSQAEDYKYVGDEVTCSVIVGTVSSNCDVLNVPDEKEIGDSQYTLTWDDENAADTLYFQNYCQTNHTGGVNVEQYIKEDGVWQWVRVYQIVYADTKWNDYGNYSTPLNQGAKGVRFSRYGTYKRYFQNVRVSRAKRFDIEDADGNAITEIDMPSKSASGDATTATFYVDYSTCDTIIKVVSDHPHITVSDASFSSTTAGRKAITLTYNSSETEEISATVTIYTRYDHETLTVNAETLGKLSTTLEYIGSDSYSVNADNVAATSLFQVRDQNGDLVASPTITLSSSNTSAINTVSSNTAIDFLCGADDVRITASYAGDATYAAASNSGTFYHDIDVIKSVDVITWDGSIINDTLHVWADRDIAYSIASANTSATKKITFTSRDATIVRVTSGETSDELRALKHGTTRLVAQTTADCSYGSVKDSIVVIVDSCDHYIVWDQKFSGLSTRSDFTIDTTIVLTAYAVDSSNVATEKEITYTLSGADLSKVSIVDRNKLRITGECDDVYVKASTSADDKYGIATASRGIRVRRYGAGCDSEVTDVTGGVNDLHKVSGYTNKNGFIYPIPPSDTIFVIVGRESSITCDSIKFLGYDSNDVETLIKGYDPYELKDDGELKEILVDEKYRKIKIIARGETGADWGPNGGTQYKWFRDLHIKQKSYLRSSRATITNDRVHVYDAINETVVVSYSDKPLLNYRITGNKLTLTPSETINNDCGDYGSYTFTVSGTYTTTGRFRDTIYITTTALDTLRIPIEFKVSAGTELYFQTSSGAWDSDTKWSNESGVIQDQVPEHDNPVVIKEAVTISTQVEAYKVKIEEGGSVTIAPNGGLSVGAGGISGATTSNFILQAGTEGVTKGKTGYLRISPEDFGSMPHAKVELYSIAYHNINSDESDDAKWQHVGIPVATDALAKTFFSKSWIYSYEESSDTWVNNRKTLVMEPFVGYATTQYQSEAGMLVTFPGQLVPNRGTKIIDLEYSGTSYGHNRIANSYAAPIDITQFRDTDFIRAEKTIYIYNTGSKNNSSLAKSATGNNAGQWTAVSIGTALEMATRFAEDPFLPKTIAPMQGFCVNAQAEGAKFKLDYNKLVWNADYSSHAPTALRAPKRNADAAEEEEMPITGSMKMTLEANGLTDNIYLLESERYMTDFEDGYDAHKMESGTLNIFTVENEDKLAIDATNSIIGTRVGVRTGEETAYTITFSYVDGEQEWALYDAETDEMIDITNDNTYTFFAEPNSNITERFMIVESNGAQIPAVTTGNDKVTSDVRAHKFIKDGELFILKNGVLYDVTGARVK